MSRMRTSRTKDESLSLSLSLVLSLPLVAFILDQAG